MTESVNDPASQDGRFRVPIEEGKVREFARSLHSNSAAHEGPDAVIPATLLTTALLWWAPEPNAYAALGFVQERMLHGEEEYVFHGPPPRVGDTLFGSSELVEQYEREGRRGGRMRFAKVRTSFYDKAGALVAEQRSTIIETARPS